VIKDSGRQITLFEALARNLLRVIDMLPQFYLIGVISMLCNRQHRRLGDFVAGTIVVHERPSEQPATSYSSRSITASIHPQVNPVPERTKLAYDPPADAVARLRPEDLAVIDSFLARALDFDLTTRAQIANRIATSMFAKMNLQIPPDINPERALEGIVYRMRAQSRL
jgi:hypothetical protein